MLPFIILACGVHAQAHEAPWGTSPTSSGRRSVAGRTPDRGDWLLVKGGPYPTALGDERGATA